MSTAYKVTTLSSTLHGCGPPVFTLHPNQPLLASVGPSKVIHISNTLNREGEPPDEEVGQEEEQATDAQGNAISNKKTMRETGSASLVHQLIPLSPSAITALAWSPSGTYLGALQQGSPIVVLWNLEEKKCKNVDV